jgi:predicted nucleic acid-binding protein
MRNSSIFAALRRPFHERQGYIVDATVVSQTWRYRADPATCEWLSSAPRGSLHVPAVVMEVIERGISLVEHKRELEHVEELKLWRNSLPGLGFTFILPLGEIQEIVGEMMRMTQLKNFWMTSPGAKWEKLPHELYVAATSIALDMEIVTRRTKGYALMEKAGIILPGLIDLRIPQYNFPERAMDRHFYHRSTLH